MYLHTRSQELSACNPVSGLLHTPGLRVRRDTNRAGAFCYTEQQVSREEANEFVHFGDFCPGATVGNARVSGGKSPETDRKMLEKGGGGVEKPGDRGCDSVGEKERGSH